MGWITNRRSAKMRWSFVGRWSSVSLPRGWAFCPEPIVTSGVTCDPSEWPYKWVTGDWGCNPTYELIGLLLPHFITGSGTTGPPCITTKLRCSQFWQLHLLFRGWWWIRLFFGERKVQRFNEQTVTGHIFQNHTTFSPLMWDFVWFTNWCFACFFPTVRPLKIQLL